MSEEARNDVMMRIKERDNQMRKSFMATQRAKTFYADAVSKKGNIYMSSMNFADRSKDEVYKKLMKAEKNYKHLLEQKLESFVP